MRLRPIASFSLLAALLAGCAAGPHQLRRSVDDWDHAMYVNSPRWNGLLWIVPVIPVATLGAFAVDTLITDPWAFWFGDVWDNAGTGYEHLPVETTDGRMQSLWLGRARWTRIER
jgi:hypothetical protein